MIFRQKEYDELKEIILGAREKSPLVQEFGKWIKSNYSVMLLDIRWEKTPEKQHVQKLSFILENQSHGLYKHKKEIIIEFNKTVSAYMIGSQEISKETFVEFVDFQGEATGFINRKSAIEARSLFIERYPIVWEIQAEGLALIVFYFTEKDVLKNEGNGTSTKIKYDYHCIIKKYDELNYFNLENLRIIFDSKENVDKNYMGSLFYYSRR